jgi:hypothetical protein
MDCIAPTHTALQHICHLQRIRAWRNAIGKRRSLAGLDAVEGKAIA